MKKLIVIGKNSYLSGLAIKRFESVYSEVILISMNTPSDWDFKFSDTDKIDIIDFNVVSSLAVKGRYVQLLNQVSSKLVKYVCVSTEMHNSENRITLSSYRKYKLKQEQWLNKLCGDVLIVIRSPDVLDSLTWNNISDGENVFKLSSIMNKEIILSGIKSDNLIDAIQFHLENNKQQYIFNKNNAYLIVTNRDVNGVKQKVKYVLIFLFSKSIIFNEIKGFLLPRKNRQVSCKSKPAITYYAGGFSDL